MLTYSYYEKSISIEVQNVWQMTILTVVNLFKRLSQTSKLMFMTKKFVGLTKYVFLWLHALVTRYYCWSWWRSYLLHLFIYHFLIFSIWNCHTTQASWIAKALVWYSCIDVYASIPFATNDSTKLSAYNS